MVAGGLTGTRTLDHLIKSQMLYQLSYQPATRKTHNYTAKSQAVNVFCAGELRSNREQFVHGGWDVDQFVNIDRFVPFVAALEA